MKKKSENGVNEIPIELNEKYHPLFNNVNRIKMFIMTF